MSRFIDMTGWVMKEHGVKDSRWTVIEQSEDAVQPNGKHIKMWNCICECGKIESVNGNNLRSGKSKSCGCLSIEIAKGNFGTGGVKKHGCAKTRLYYVWTHIKARCYNSHTDNYKDYGGRGIKMCDEWRGSFQNFQSWALSHGYADNLTIDRIKVNGDYEPSNCRWVTQKEQANNKRNNVFFTYNGRTKTLKQWCDYYGKDYRLVHNRINYGKWCFEEALLYDVRQKPSTGKEVVCENQTFISVAECARYYKINSRTLNSWLNGDRKMPDDWKRKGLCFKELYVK